MDTAAWLDALGRRELRPGTWTLEVILELCGRLGDPQDALRAIHVAGTRGKGSTCALLESALRAEGFRTGLTTSPHLRSPRERIRLDGRDVDEASFASLVERVREAGAERLHAGYFEVMTAAAFLAFAESRVDVAVIETGLGGRVDATNVVSPRVAVITRLGMDHADRLGGTRASIAAEKAGILKPAARAVLAPNLPEAADVVRARAAELGVPLREVSERDIELAPPTSLPGETQRENAAVAACALEELALAEPALAVGRAALERGFATVRWRARLELMKGALGGADLLLDVAHDGDGTRALVRHLGGRRPAAIVFSCLADKDLAVMADLLAASEEARGAAMLVPELDGARARPAAEVVAALRERGLSARPAPSVAEALEAAQAIALASPGPRPALVVAFGSFHVASRALEHVEPA